MPLSLTQYEGAYEQKKELARTVAESLIVTMDARDPEMPLNCCTNLTTTGVDETRLWMVSVLDIVSSIMFSSGYWHSYTCRVHRDKKLRIVHSVSIMSQAERQENGLQDPSAKSEIGDPPLEQSPAIQNDTE